MPVTHSVKGLGCCEKACIYGPFLLRRIFNYTFHSRNTHHNIMIIITIALLTTYVCEIKGGQK